MSSFVLGLQSYRKTREKANFFTYFLFFIGVQASKLGVFALFRDGVSYPKLLKVGAERHRRAPPR
jgi:hypothetical protein